MYSAKFWRERDEYHDLAETFERNIEVIHPEEVTSRSMCPCLDWARSCPHPLEGKAEYYEYRGPSV